MSSKKPDPKETVLFNLLALGCETPTPLSTVYQEWALRLAPRSEIAAQRPFDNYSDTHQYADAARVAQGMVRHLPAGPERECFAELPKTVKGRKNEPLPTPHDGSVPPP